MTIEVGYQDVESDLIEARTTRWTPDATGHRWWIFEVDVAGLRPVGIEAVAEAAYQADNDYGLDVDSLAGRIQAAMSRVYETTSERHHSLSVGDRVRVGEAEVVCCGSGWRPVHAGDEARRSRAYGTRR